MAIVPNIRSNVFVPFPATVGATGPVLIAKNNGVWTVSLTITQLPPVPGGSDPATKTLLVQDQASGTFQQTPLASASALALANVPSFGKNVVGRNGGLEVWQRLVGAGTTIAVGAGVQAYTVDGWYVDSVTATTATWTVTQIAGLTVQSRFAAKVQRNNGQTGIGQAFFAFPLDVDELNKLKGLQALLSFTAKPGANWSPAGGTLGYRVLTGTGAGPAKRGHTAYTGEVIPLTGTVSLTAGGAAQRVVSTLATIFTTTITQAEVQFFWTPVGTAGADDSVSFDDIQLEVVNPGIAAFYPTPLFERTDFAWDLERCERFLPVYDAPSASATDFAAGITTTTTTGRYVVPFRVDTRVPITGITVSSPGHFNGIDSGGTARLASAITFANGGTGAATLTATIATGTVGGGTLQSANAAAQIIFTGAEI